MRFACALEYFHRKGLVTLRYNLCIMCGLAAQVGNGCKDPRSFTSFCKRPNRISTCRREVEADIR